MQCKLASHGNTVLARRKKKSTQKLEACILQVEPAICQHRWSNVNTHYAHEGSKAARK